MEGILPILSIVVAVAGAGLSAWVALTTEGMKREIERERLKAERERLDAERERLTVEHGEASGLRALLLSFDANSKKFDTLLNNHYPFWKGKPEALEELLRKAGAVRYPGGQGGDGLWGLPERNPERMR